MTSGSASDSSASLGSPPRSISHLRANDATAVLPVIMVTSSIGQEKTKAIEAGRVAGRRTHQGVLAHQAVSARTEVA